ncbi:IS5 family transposase [Galbibacter sp. EGI 63066]|uniref:IS5 family transposase n=1 Tax=Galbibacter sp. EGI 63066 TaxID=2993559 RepID=UPI002248EB04|nr:IS5 family transposase [Galbibacter sp. EGI 63066]MCX2681997.1 IS5 family transposase [Galbibacter sp. EGI 63066]
MADGLLPLQQVEGMEVIEEVMHRLRELARKKRGKNAGASAGIIDSQSVKSGLPNAMKGFDGNKKVNGRKRHIVTDTNGWLLAVLVHSANLHDGTMAVLLFRRLRESIHGILAVFADGGYRGKLVENAAKALGFTIGIVMRTDNAERFKVVPKRWVVERSFAWMNAHRRLSKDYEFLCESAETMVQLSAIKIMLNKI